MTGSHWRVKAKGDPNLSLQKDHSEALVWRWIKGSGWDWKTSVALSVIQARGERKRISMTSWLTGCKGKRIIKGSAQFLI